MRVIRHGAHDAGLDALPKAFDPLTAERFTLFLAHLERLTEEEQQSSGAAKAEAIPAWKFAHSDLSARGFSASSPAMLLLGCPPISRRVSRWSIKRRTLAELSASLGR